MEKVSIQRYNNMNMIHKTNPTYKHVYTGDFDIRFRPFQISLLRAQTFFAINMDLTSIGMKSYIIKTI